MRGEGPLVTCAKFTTPCYERVKIRSCFRNVLLKRAHPPYPLSSHTFESAKTIPLLAAYVYQKVHFVYFSPSKVAYLRVFRQFCAAFYYMRQHTNYSYIYILAMKKFSISLALLAGALTLTSCGTTGSLGQSSNSNILGSSSSSTTTGSILSGASTIGSILGNILSNSSSLSQKDIVGTWNYSGSDCVFKSENLLAKAGGAVAANKVKSELNTQLAKFGIKEGACSFTFNSDNTYSAKIGNRTIQGNYTLDTTNKTVKMTYLGGLASMTPHVAKSGGKLSLLIESDKVLSLLKGVSALGKGTSMSAINSILGNYDGLYVGMQLSK